MADARFFQPRGPFALGELATIAEAELADGDPDLEIRDVAPLDTAEHDQITFLDHRRYLPAARRTRGGACLIRASFAGQLPSGVARLLTDHPYRGYARVAALFHPSAAAPCATHPPAAGIATGASIDATATLGPGCRIAPGAVVEAAAEIGPRCRIEANAVIGAAVVLGADCVVGAGATLSHCLIGARVVIHPGARIGQDGFGFALDGAAADQAAPLKVPQIGRVLIEDDVEIGANSTIDRGSAADTVIGRGCKIDNLVMIAHNVRLGSGCVVVAQSGISGSTRIGADSVLAAQVGIVGHLTLGPGVRLAARSAVTRDLPGDATYGGAPAVPVRQWRRQMAAIGRLAKKRGSP